MLPCRHREVGGHKGSSDPDIVSGSLPYLEYEHTFLIVLQS